MREVMAKLPLMCFLCSVKLKKHRLIKYSEPSTMPELGINACWYDRKSLTLVKSRMLSTEEIGFDLCPCPTYLSTTGGCLGHCHSMVISLAFSRTLLLLFELPASRGIALSAPAYPSIPFPSALSSAALCPIPPNSLKVFSLIVWLSYFWTSEAELVPDMPFTLLKILDFDGLDSLLTSVLILDSPNYLSGAFLVRKWFSNVLDGIPFFF